MDEWRGSFFSSYSFSDPPTVTDAAIVQDERRPFWMDQGRLFEYFVHPGREAVINIPCCREITILMAPGNGHQQPHCVAACLQANAAIGRPELITAAAK